MGWLVELLLGSVLKWFSGWIGAKQEAKKLTQAQDNQAHADAGAAIIQDHASQEVENAQQNTDTALASANTDAGNPAKLRADVQAAIDRANSNN